MALRISGTLYDPFSAPAVGASIRFTAESTSTQVLDCYTSTSTTDEDGGYTLNIREGVYKVETRQASSTQWCTLATGLIIDESVTSADLNLLILESDPDGPGTPSLSAQIDAIAQVADDAAQLAAGASDAASASQASATSASASATAAQGYAVEAQGHSNNAQGFASNAQGFASDAEASAAAAAQSASDAIIPAATETEIGGVEVATSAEALAGTAGKFPDAAKVHGAFGQYGLGNAVQSYTSDIDGEDTAGWWGWDENSGSVPVGGGTRGAGLTMVSNVGDRQSQIAIANQGFTSSMFYRANRAGEWQAWREMRHEGNTVIDANGFVKEASPVLRLHGDGALTSNGHPDLANATASRSGTGVYEVSGTLGLASSGWNIQTPEDANGRRKVFVEYEEIDGIISVQTFVADYANGAPVKGDPLDIPGGRWIDIRTNETPPE